MTKPITCIPVTLKRKITGIEDIPGDLIETLQELAARLTVLASWGSSGITGMRVIGAGGSYAVTGTFYQTTQPISQALIGSHTANVIAIAQNNLTAILGNINNVTPA